MNWHGRHVHLPGNVLLPPTLHSFVPFVFPEQTNSFLLPLGSCSRTGEIEKRLILGKKMKTKTEKTWTPPHFIFCIHWQEEKNEIEKHESYLPLQKTVLYNVCTNCLFSNLVLTLFSDNVLKCTFLSPLLALWNILLCDYFQSMSEKLFVKWSLAWLQVTNASL